MPTCVMKGCKNSSAFQNKSIGITFHKFPTDTFWKSKWIKLIRRNRADPEWLPSKFSVLCSLHFEEADMHVTKGGLRRIQKNALPIRYKLVDSEWCLDEGKLQVPTIKQEPVDYSEFPTEDVEGNSGIKQETDEDYQFDHIPPESLVISCSPNEDYLDSDDESIYDSPNEYKLKKRIKFLRERGKVQAKRIKVLSQHIRRLKIRNLRLKTTLIDLKVKYNIDNKKLYNIE